LSDSPNFTLPQLAAARATHWQQNGQPILTLEAIQQWLQQIGLVLYTPRKLQIAAPAPSFAEAVHGTTTAELTLAQLQPAEELLQHLIASNQAVALNLTGTLGETPDFVVSVHVLPYIFTLRGDKNWKQPPGGGVAGRVSPLATRLHELLTEHGALNTRDLMTHAGREVTEAAVLRALGDLWSQLRVFPRPQADGAPTQWELASAHFTKQLKAGANAGVPTALSALISLYLGAAIAVTTEEIEIFLSPLSSRSKIREVVHGLIATRQLEETVVDGKTLLHVAGSLPVFAPIAREPKAFDPDAPAPEELRSETETPAPGFKPRIAKFAPRAGAAGKSFGKPAFGEKKPFRGGSSDRERRPFSGGGDRPPRREFTPREGGDSRPPRRDFGGKPSFGPRKPFGDRKPFGERSGSDRPARPFTPRDGGGSRPPRREFGGKPGFGGTRPSPRRDFGGKPSFTKPWEEERKPRPASRENFDAAAESGATGGHSTPRYPRFDDRKPGAARPPRRDFKPREGSDSRPPRRDFKPREGSDSHPPRRDFKPREGGDSRPPRRDFKPRPEGDARPPRRFDTVGGGKKPFTPGGSKFGGPKTFGAKKFDGPRSSSGPRKFGEGENRGPREFGESKKFGGPKKFGGDSKFGGAKKFGPKKKYDSGKGKPRPQGASKPKRKEGDAE